MKLISATVVVIKLCSLRVIVCVEVLRPSQPKIGHVKRGQFTKPHVYWAGLVLLVVNQYCAHSFARN